MKSTLYRFVTLRNPQLIAASEKEKGFVSFPDSFTNTFTNAIAAKPTTQSKREALTIAASSFAPLETVTAVRAIDSVLFDFSSWLMRNKKTLTDTELTSNVGSATTLNATNLGLIWENLMYQTVTKASNTVREACIQLLIASNFLAKNDLGFRTPDILIQNEEDLRKLACASVVIPNAIDTSDERENFKAQSGQTVNDQLVDDLNEEKLRILNEELNTARKEVKHLQSEIDRKNRIAYDTQFANYDLNLEDSISQYIIRGASFEVINGLNISSGGNDGGGPSLGGSDGNDGSNGGNDGSGDSGGDNSGGGGGEIIAPPDGGSGGGSGDEGPSLIGADAASSNPPETTLIISDEANPSFTAPDPTDGVEVVVDPLKLHPNTLGPSTPAFRFTPVDRFDITQLTGRISARSIEIIQGFNLANDSTSVDVINAIDQEITKVNASLQEITNKPDVRVRVAGVTLSKRNISSAQLYCYALDFERFLTDGDNAYFNRMLMNINLGGSRAHIESATYRMETTGSAAAPITGTSVKVVKRPLNSPSQILALFPQTLTISLDDIPNPARFVGEFTLSSGVVLYIDQEVTLSSTVTTTGCASLTPVEETPEDRFYGISKIGIADFRRVEQTLCCYIPGEVSHIENVLAREYREKTSRTLTSEEQTLETTDVVESEQLTDTTSTQRNELSTEVSSVLTEDQSKSFSASVGLSFSFLKAQTNINASSNFASSSSSTDSNSIAKNEAQEITERALNRVVQKITTKRVSTIRKEYEETNRHAFDNREGDKNVTGVYRWVDKIYKNQLVNYGKRLVYEFMIPEPANFFKTAILEDVAINGEKSEIGEIVPVEPASLSARGASSADKLTRANYQRIAAYYGIEVEAPPKEFIHVSAAFSKSQAPGDSETNENLGISEVMEIPEGYVTRAAEIQGTKRYGSVIAAVGDAILILNQQLDSNGPQKNQTFREQPIKPHTNELAVSIYFNRTWLAIINVIVKCELTDEAFANWQNTVYAQLVEAYNEKISAYNEYVRSIEFVEEGDSSKITISEGQYRSIEQRELKRNAIQMLTRPHGVAQGKQQFTPGDYDIPSINLTPEFDTYSNQVKFFEQVFDWELMGYNFYPYYWAQEADWKTLFQYTEGKDPIFQAFLQSGMARMVVPVRPGFEDAILYYLETGEVFGGENLSLENELYLSIVDELRTVEGEVEETWETRVPTTLNIVQAESVGLNEGGLPCSCPEHQGFESVTNLLGKDTTSNDGGGATLITGDIAAS
jgi:uncharacterized membrane protein YgcG